MRQSALRQAVIGYGVSLLLTGAAFAAVYSRLWPARVTVGVVVALGFGQMLLHLGVFLRASLQRSARGSVLFIVMAALIIAIMVCGTLVILFNLRGRMM